MAKYEHELKAFEGLAAYSPDHAYQFGLTNLQSREPRWGRTKFRC
jgi:hypothetical protein